jgi:ATP adenylyltransferase
VTLDSPPPLIDSSRLAALVAARFRASGESGSRQALATREVVIEDDGLPFVVRVLRARAKPGEQGDQPDPPRSASLRPENRSPFLPPYDPTLLIGAISTTHVCLLNKYNVVDRHLLIVTRAFEDQESPLQAADLRAALVCLHAIDGLVFCNSGPAAGASQSHKHLQLVPFPLGPGAERFPFDRAVAAALDRGLDHLPDLPYRHQLVPLPAPPPGVLGPPPSPVAGLLAANAMPRSDALAPVLRAYLDLVATFALEREGGRRLAPHNLLMTRDWMLVVPRASGACGTIEVNALGFAGALLARGEEGLAQVRETGPLEVLRRVAVPW